MAHVFIPRARYVVSMDFRDLSSIVASKLRNVYMKHYHLDRRRMLEMRRRYGVPKNLAMIYDDAHATLKYDTIVEQWNQERLRCRCGQE